MPYPPEPFYQHLTDLVPGCDKVLFLDLELNSYSAPENELTKAEGDYVSCQGLLHQRVAELGLEPSVLNWRSEDGMKLDPEVLLPAVILTSAASAWAVPVDISRVSCQRSLQ